MNIFQNSYLVKDNRLVIKLPESFGGLVDVIVIPKIQKKTNNYSKISKNFYSKFNIDLSDFKFNREEANER